MATWRVDPSSGKGDSQGGILGKGGVHSKIQLVEDFSDVLSLRSVLGWFVDAVVELVVGASALRFAVALATLLIKSTASAYLIL